MSAYDVVCCCDCGFGFASGLPDPAEFETYYAAMSKYEKESISYVASGTDLARCDSIVDLVDPFVEDRGIAVLDVGCSTGALLSVFKRRGYDHVEGLDPSPACAISARDMYDIPVRTGTAAEIADMPRGYGLVILSAVLEHLLDPLQTLCDVWRVVADGGLLFVEVPDVEGFVDGAMAPYQEFSVEHINYFSTLSLTSIMAAAGFTPASVDRRRIPWFSQAQAPAIDAVYRKRASAQPIIRDSVSEPALRNYVASSERIEAQVAMRIRSLAERGRPVVVWGVGTHTRHLLKSGAFGGLQVAAWVDSDPKYAGTALRGAPVIGPDAVACHDEAILVSSGTVHHEIVRQIRDDLGLSNEIVLLYD